MTWRDLVPGRAVLGVGDCRELLRQLPAESVDACVTDDPYELGFMGKDWDSAGVSFDPVTWVEVLRVLKPGGYLFAFGGTRTQHRIGCAIEDAGFWLLDEVQWIYGSGFPKNLDVTKNIDRRLGVEREVVGSIPIPGAEMQQMSRGGAEGNAWTGVKLGPPVSEEAKKWAGFGTALKPAHEPIYLAQRPFKATFADQLLERGVGALNLGACRVGQEVTYTARRGHSGDHGVYGGDDRAGVRVHDTPGRHPPNVLLTHSADCVVVGTKVAPGHAGYPSGPGGNGFHGGVGRLPDGSRVEAHEGIPDREVPAYRCAEDCPVALMDRQSGHSRSRIGQQRKSRNRPTFSGNWGMSTETSVEYDDAGGASRFFPAFEWCDLDYELFLYQAKPTNKERDLGLEDLPVLSGGDATDRKDGSAGLNSPRAGAGRRGGRRNPHPTVKPLALMRWLVRLVTPPGGLVLDPFAGSGTTGMAALREGFRFLGCELSPQYAEVAARRIQACSRG